ncbi:putative phosphoprotein [Wuhan House Fly Virus 1]|uniref:Putative phosphoprotein n=1 Tax=Wuhan House Fly Virus 1 TaxID=1608104 RepID=A0A0B5KF04_9RHAB|nr:putative phosphoprotein [Wuhan House Fly Virus 1]AJG39164.1 putative phosphoprotein [Wuhan House Fly Virus 1]
MSTDHHDSMDDSDSDKQQQYTPRNTSNRRPTRSTATKKKPEPRRLLAASAKPQGQTSSTKTTSLAAGFQATNLEEFRNKPFDVQEMSASLSTIDDADMPCTDKDEENTEGHYPVHVKDSNPDTILNAGQACAELMDTLQGDVTGRKRRISATDNLLEIDLTARYPGKLVADMFQTLINAINEKSARLEIHTTDQVMGIRFEKVESDPPAKKVNSVSVGDDRPTTSRNVASQLSSTGNWMKTIDKLANEGIIVEPFGIGRKKLKLRLATFGLSRDGAIDLCNKYCTPVSKPSFTIHVLCKSKTQIKNILQHYNLTALDI